MTNCTIEVAGEGWAQPLAALHASCFAQGWDAASLGLFLQDPTCTALGARDAKGNILGFVLLRRAADEAEILTLAVAPKARRGGIATKLLDAAAPVLAARGVRKLHLEVGHANSAALSLYASLGFARVGLRRGYYRHPDGEAEDAILLAREIL